MIKLIMAGIWVCAVTLAASYFALSWTEDKVASNAKEVTYFGGLEHVRPASISVPIIKEGVVEGYAVAQFAFTAPADVLMKMTVPAKVIFVDEAFKAIYANTSFDFLNNSKRDLNALLKTIAENVNARVEQGLVVEVLVESLNFVSKDQVRCQNQG
jgi:hypothetical protein